MATYEEYLDYLKANLSWLESASDKFSGADERLDYAVKQLLAIRPPIEALDGLLHEFREAGYIMPRVTDQITFHQTIPIISGVRLEEDIPLDGAITSVAMHFPPCASPLNPTPLEIAVGHGSRQFMPYGGFIALDNTTPVFPAHENVSRNETVWCVMQNTDTINPHTCSVIVTMEGE